MLKRFPKLMIILLAAVSLWGCSKEDKIIKCLDEGSMSLDFLVNGEPLDIPISSTFDKFDAITLNTQFPNEFVLQNPSDFDYVRINGEYIKGKTPLLVKINAIAYNKEILVEYSYLGHSKRAYIRTLPETLPDLITSGESPYEGHYYISFVDKASIAKLDQKGNIVYYRHLETEGGFWDFKKHVVASGTYYSFNECDYSYDKLALNGYAPGARVIMDSSYKIIDRIECVQSSGIQTGMPAEGHDFYMFDRNHYILSNYVLSMVPSDKFPKNILHNTNGSKVVSSYLQEVKDGKVVFDWWSIDHPELFELSDTYSFDEKVFDFTNTNNQTPDYVHFNSIDIDPKDGNWICSFRHISTIAKINSKTGDIVWKLSGKGDEFGLTDEQKTHGQHYARLTGNGYITVFDNHNNPDAPQTRIVKYKIDETTKKLIDFVEYKDGAYRTEACGSAMLIDPENDVFVIGWGIGAAGFQRVLSEIDFKNGKKYFEITQIVPQAETSYRCAKYK